VKRSGHDAEELIDQPIHDVFAAILVAWAPKWEVFCEGTPVPGDYALVVVAFRALWEA